MRKQFIIICGRIVGVVAVFLAVTILPAFCEPAKTVAIVPMEMNSTEDLSFLQKGLFSMLSARMADPGKVVILEKDVVEKAMIQARNTAATRGALDETKARLIGAGLKADYLLYGSLTLFGKSMSLDMFMVDVQGLTPTLSFSKQAKDPGAVITEMDKIADEINLKTFHRKPEQVLPEEFYASQAKAAAPESRDSYASPLTNFRYLYTAGGNMNGIAVGDVDGDKKNEVVVIYDHDIEILKDNLGGKLKMVKHIDQGEYNDAVAVDVADINGNGIDEIFITRVETATGYLKSLVLEYRNGTFTELADDLPWYLRVVTRGSQKILYAQKSGKKGPYAGRNIFTVGFNGSRYVPENNFMFPQGCSIMGLAAGTDISGSGVKGYVYTDKEGQLILVNENGKIEWSGEPGYGGSKLFYTFVDPDKILVDSSQGNGAFFQPRNLVYDVGSDGKPDLVVIKNKEAANYLFGELRNFKSGSIEIMNWNEMGLSPQTAGKNIPGQITDIMTGDFDHDGKKELLVSVIKKRSNFSAKNSKSIIIAYDL